MIKAERDIWISLLEEARQSGEWGDPQKCGLCRFAGLINPTGEKGVETCCCPRCILTRYVDENRGEVENIFPAAKDIDLVNPDKDHDYYEEFDHFLGVCVFLEGYDSYAAGDENFDSRRQNVAFWCDQVIKWLQAA